MLRRFGFFILMNFAILMMVSIVLNLLGISGYIGSQGINYSSLMIFCLVWGMAGSFISLMLSKFMAKKMMGVKIIDERGPYAHITRAVHQYSKAAGLPKMPEVGIFESPEINAFATGPSKSNSLVAVSTGLINNLSQDEMEGVIGHEVAHIANGDMVTTTLLQGVVNAFVMFFARIAAYAVQNAMSGDDDDAPVGGGMAYFITVLVFDAIFGFLGMFVTSYFSRTREYRADIGGAKLAGKDKMVNALKKLQTQLEQGIIDDRHSEMNSMKISSNKNSLLSLLSTHPDLSDRINALNRAR